MEEKPKAMLWTPISRAFAEKYPNFDHEQHDRHFEELAQGCDSFAIDEKNWEYLFPGIPLHFGEDLEALQKRAEEIKKEIEKMIDEFRKGKR